MIVSNVVKYSYHGRDVFVREDLKGSLLHAIYAAGRASWDTKALEGYAVAHPEILQFKKVGEPSVSIREMKETKKE